MRLAFSVYITFYCRSKMNLEKRKNVPMRTINWRKMDFVPPFCFCFLFFKVYIAPSHVTLKRRLNEIEMKLFKFYQLIVTLIYFLAFEPAENGTKIGPSWDGLAISW